MTQIARTDSHQSDQSALVSMIERVALDPNASIEKLERMLAMKERLDAEYARRAFNEALAACQAEMPAIAARHVNDQTRSKYAKLADIYRECKPIAQKHGISFNAVPVIGGREGFMNMRWTLRHGAHVESDVSEIPIDDKGMKGTANKTGTHAYGSTTSYGRRYLFCAVMDLAIGDDDDDGNAAGKGTITEDQYVSLREKLERSGANELKFLEFFKIAHLEELPAAKYGSADAMLNQKMRTKNA